MRRKITFADTSQLIDLKFGEFNVIGGGDIPWYDGAYNVTPAREAQTLLTNGKAMRHNVVVAPIPSNYGLITYNGYELTVS